MLAFGAQFLDKLYLSRDIPEDDWVSKGLLAPVSAKPPSKMAKPPPKAAAQSIPMHSGDHMKEFKVKGRRTNKRHTEHIMDWAMSH